MTLVGVGEAEAEAEAYVIERVFGSAAGEQIRPLGRSTIFGIKKWKASTKKAEKIRGKVAITIRKAKTEQIYEERRRMATKSWHVLTAEVFYSSPTVTSFFLLFWQKKITKPFNLKMFLASYIN